MPAPKATAPAAPSDAASTAKQLYDVFYDHATALRDSATGLPLPDADRIDAQADQVEECGDGFTADAIADILGTLQADLSKIQSVTKQANDQVKKLQTADEIISVATLVLAVGTAAASGDPAAIIKAVQTLQDSVSGTASTADASSSASATDKS